MHIASVPYDVVSSSEARALAEGKPDSFLHVVRPEIDLPEDVDPYSDAVYDQAKANLEAFRSNGLLQSDGTPAIYLYRLTRNGQSQTGVVCCCDAEQYRSGLIKRHEFTRPDKENDRTQHLLVSETHAEPVFLTFRDHQTIAQLIEQDTQADPDTAFVADDGVQHECWRAGDSDAYVQAFANLPAMYIADGHHRSAAAERAARSRMEENPSHDGNEEYNKLLAVCFPMTELVILPYNRVVFDLNNHTPEQLLEQLRTVGTLTPTDATNPPSRGQVCVFVGGSWYLLTFAPEKIDLSDPVGSLDCALLQSLVLDPILGITDPRTDKRIGFVGGIHPTSELERRAGTDGVAFSMYPTSMDELLSVADSDLIMPPKSTWFEPKLRSGLFVHSFSGS